MGLWYPYYKPKRVTQVATQTFTSTGAVNINEMVQNVEAGARYNVSGFISFQSGVTTTGFGLGFIGPATSRFMGSIQIPTSSLAAVTSNIKIAFPNSATLNQGTCVSTGVNVINTNFTAEISGILVVGATGGTFQLLAATEVAASPVVIQVGSELILQRFE